MYESVRKSYLGSSAPTTLAVAISAATTSITLTAGSSFPTGSEGPGPFVISIGRNTVTEEKILCTSRTGNVITVLQRGYDNTTALDHDDGDAVLHVLDALTVDQVNKLANVGTTAGDFPYFSAAGVPARRGIGTEGYPLLSLSGVPNYGQVANAGVSPTAGIAQTKLGSVPRVSVHKSVAQSIPASTATAILFDTEDYDALAMHSTVTNTDRLTIPAGYGGLWMFGYSITMAGAASSTYVGGAWVQRSGSANEYAAAQQSLVAAVALTGSAPIDMAAGDYAILVAFQNSPGALNAGNGVHSPFWAYYIGPSA